MVDKQTILDVVYNAAAHVNEMLPQASRLDLNEAEVIIGAGARIDSLGFVSLMVAVEERVEKLAGHCASLTEELSDPSANVRTLGALAEFIAGRL